MTSVDGNYLKMQGEALARMQVAYQAETQAQQVRAQAASERALRQLSQEVLAMSSPDGQNRGMAPIGQQGGKAPGKGFSRGPKMRPVDTEEEAPEVKLQGDEGCGSRLDVRI